MGTWSRSKFRPIKGIPPNAWEWVWAPYDRVAYQSVLDSLSADDIVLEIGAGDLRLVQLMAPRVRFVYAIELQEEIAFRSTEHLPDNCRLIIGDARKEPFPKGITTAVLLMRHCTHFQLYWQKLSAVSCKKLITNARWGLDIETINLRCIRLPFSALQIGWYACQCGHTGFLPGPPEKLNDDLMNTIREVENCPRCSRRHNNLLSTSNQKETDHGWNRTRLP